MEHRVLWIVNMVMPELASHLKIKTGASGTWMIDLSRRLVEEQNCKLAIACIYGSELKKYSINGIVYYTVPGVPRNMYMYTPELGKYWNIINNEFKPDLVHLHGTEYSHGLSFLRHHPTVPALLTIQGIMHKIAEHAFDGITLKEAVLSNTLKELIHFNGMYANNLLRKRNLKYETEIISRVKYVTGRTDWDKSFVCNINPNIEYFRVFYNLRDVFYDTPKWNIHKIERYTIYGSTSLQAILKGGHILLRAINIVKRKYPNVKAYFLLDNTIDNRFQVNNGFGLIVKKIIDKYHLSENVYCIPRQNAQGVIDHMLNCHCAVIPSAMENASATLREAMHLGVPCVAAYRGGMAELINEAEDGFLYDFPEHEVLASKICTIFANDSLAVKLSKNAIEKASNWHDRMKNPKDMDNVYKAILKKEKE